MIKHVVFVLGLLCSCANSLSGQNFDHQPVLPYDMIVVGVDSDVSAQGGDHIIILAAMDMRPGFKFGITNGMLNSGSWTTLSGANHSFANLTYHGSDIIPVGSAISLVVSSTTIDVSVNGRSMNTDFDVDLSTNYQGDFISQNTFAFTAYSGFMHEGASGNHLFGIATDMITYGLTTAQQRALEPQEQFAHKEFNIGEGLGSITKVVDIENCLLCQLLLDILYGENWLNLTNTFGFDINDGPFDLTGCVQTECPPFDLVVEVDVECKMLVPTSDPCAGAVKTYTWQKKVDNVFITEVSSTTATLGNLDLTAGGYYQLVVQCPNGCTYTSNEIFVDCYETECSYDIDVVAIGDCTLEASVTGCSDAVFQWFYSSGSGVQIVSNGNSPILQAEDSGNYFVEVYGCNDCPINASDNYPLDCGEPCDCSIALSESDCVITIVDANCSSAGLFEYYLESASTWVYIELQGNTYVPDEFGNGMYRYTVSTDGCDDQIEIIDIDCVQECDEVSLSGNMDGDCQLRFDWAGCSNPSFELQYSADCSTYYVGGAQLLDYTSNTDGTGYVTFQPLHTTGCYKLILGCSESCTALEGVVVANGDCCPSDLEITEDNCLLTVDNVPCTGPFTFAWSLDGVAISSGTEGNFGPLVATEDGLYQLVLDCNGCSFFSNAINVNCGTEECIPEAFLSVDECTLVVVGLECENATVQWQKQIGSSWQDISGATEASYLVEEDAIYRAVLTNCDCAPHSATTVEYEAEGCSPCECLPVVQIDNSECVLSLGDDNCDLLTSVSWYYQDQSGVWQHLSQFDGLTQFEPLFNGSFKAILTDTDGCTGEGVATVGCTACAASFETELDDDCYLTVDWTDCYEYDGFDLFFYPNATDCNNINSPGIEVEPLEVIYATDPTTGEGYLKVLPSDGAGCYSLTVSCNNGCSGAEVTEYFSWQPCCSDEPEIVYQDTIVEVCDYCFFNDCTDSLLQINVMIDGEPIVGLFDYSNYFSESYTDGCQPPVPALPGFAQLVADINSWFAEFGFEGTAHLGGGPGTCKGPSTPFWIEQTNVEFVSADIWEILDPFGSNGNPYQTQSFLKANCNDIEPGPQLTVEGECKYATYLWSDGSTGGTIDYDGTSSYSVTVTCPDGCTSVLYYSPNQVRQQLGTEDPSVGNSSLSIAAYSSSDYDIKVYPNPARTQLNVEYILSHQTEYQLELSDALGKIVLRKEVSLTAGVNKQTLNVADLHPGIYLVRILDKEEIVHSQKVAIVK